MTTTRCIIIECRSTYSTQQQVTQRSQLPYRAAREFFSFQHVLAQKLFQLARRDEQVLLQYLVPEKRQLFFGQLKFKTY